MRNRSLERSTNPFQTRGETSTTAAAQTGGLDFPNDPVVALEQDLLRLVPVAHLLGALKVGRVAAVEVLEDTVLVLEPAIDTLRGGGTVLDGREGAALGVLLRGRDAARC